ncbi:MAG: hypothetical protein KY453_06365 [Gemmatimonadetes bacterium]|nr:hypothetical protein [Gemmatimonadota bacterium]
MLVLSIYLFSLVLGGGALAVSVLGDAFGGAGDVDVGGDMDVDADGGDGHAKIFSLRAVVYALFGFGAVGTALTLWVPGLASPARLGLAVAGGLASGALITALFRWLDATDSGAPPGDATFVGLSGAVTLPLSAGTPGAIAVERGARRYTLRALPHATGGGPPGDPAAWTSVVVVEMEGGVARVVPVDEDLALEP